MTTKTMRSQAAPSPFHPAELAAQERVGVRQQMQAVARNSVREQMPEQHRIFFSQLPFFFVAALDGSGQPWATVLTGTPGFLQTPNATTLRVAAAPPPGDALAGQLAAGDYIGALGLEPSTRRRNRVNGTIDSLDAHGFQMAVKQSFGNCPQYIQSRQHFLHATQESAAPRVLIAQHLNEADRALIARADTFFIASGNIDRAAGKGRGVDISHRGGRPGFVRIDDEQTLTAPDFVGNFFFNTIGNLLAHPSAGLLFIDFDSGDMLQLAVDADVIWDGPEVKAFAGAERLLRFRVRSVRRNVGALPLRWSAPQQSPVLAATGIWSEVQQAHQATALRNTWRRLRVREVRDESMLIRSFYLHPTDGLGLAPFEAGQFLPLRVTLPGHDSPSVRTYTLSDAAHAQHYRISVKRDGAVSNWLHDQLHVGDEIETMGPGGDFVFDGSGKRPLVLLSAGIGVTPMIAILNSLLVNNGRTRHVYPIYFIHAARNQREHAFADHVRTLTARHWNLHAEVRYSAPDSEIEAEDEVVRFRRSAGRVDIDFLRHTLPFDDYDFYLCGPASFMQSMVDGLHGLNVAPERIRFEAFGPATVKIATRTNTPQQPASIQPVQEIPVRFARTGSVTKWDGSHGSLLELAEAHDLAPPSGCRSGLCGACATPLLAGQVDDTRECSATAAAGQVLLCSVRPRAAQAGMAQSEIVIDL